MRDRLTYTVGIAIAFVWTASALVGLYTHDYEGMIYITPIMTIFAGWLFGIQIVKKVKNGGS